MYNISVRIKNYGYIQILFNEKNIHIEDSYRIKDERDMKTILWIVRNASSNRGIFYTRNSKSWLREWKAHNILYKMGIFKKRTISVDLDENESWFRRVGYFFLSLFY